MEKLRLREAILVEGKYDMNALSQVVDTLIFVSHGFGIFQDTEQMALLRKVAKERGLIVFTDGDGAGFLIRNRIISSIPQEFLKHAYIPDIYGKEKRKSVGSKEGKLGVEGMSPEVLREALWSAGARVDDTTVEAPMDNHDFYLWGLTGEGSGEVRQSLLKAMGLPERMSKKALLRYLNASSSREEVQQYLRESEEA